MATKNQAIFAGRVMNIHRENLFLLVNRSKNQQPAQNIDKRHIKRNKLLLGIFTVLLPLILILVGIYIMLIIIRNHDENLKATRFEIPGLKECKLLRERRHTFVYKQGSISTNVKPVRNIFFIIDDSIMTAKEACAIESALHKFPHRKVYLMQLQCNQSTVPLIKLDYRKILYDYHNAFFVKLEPNEYLSHSPVEGMWNCKNDKAQIAAMAYTAWRFGGSIFTHQILINHRSLLSSRNLKVLITPKIFLQVINDKVGISCNITESNLIKGVKEHSLISKDTDINDFVVIAEVDVLVFIEIEGVLNGTFFEVALRAECAIVSSEQPVLLFMDSVVMPVFCVECLYL
uniref:Uncharacterized protein n=1 Tax=Rhodnius prolixus TaxID=13249 RepID=T1IDU4_RHOPR